MDLPPYKSLDEFCTALARFTTEDVRDVAQGLFSAWERARAARAFKATHRADLTISDVRRARRATGLSLSHVASVAEVPPTRVRDLEWGYMRDWPATPEGRAQVIRYARAAGLDEAVVLSIAWPMILEGAAAAAGERDTGVALVPSGPQTMVVARPVVTVAARPVRRLRNALVAAAGIVALLGAFAMGWRSTQPDPPRQDAVQRAELPAPPNEAPAALPPAPAGTADVAPAALVQTEATRSTVKSPAAPPRRDSAGASARRESPRPAVTPRPKPRPAAPAARPDEPRKPFLQRELFRIVIK